MNPNETLPYSNDMNTDKGPAHGLGEALNI